MHTQAFDADSCSRAVGRSRSVKGAELDRLQYLEITLRILLLLLVAGVETVESILGRFTLNRSKINDQLQ